MLRLSGIEQALTDRRHKLAARSQTLTEHGVRVVSKQNDKKRLLSNVRFIPQVQP
jgi:hypothetical protein